MSELKPCPFCGKPWRVSRNVIAHALDSDAECLIHNLGWDNCQEVKGKLNTRAQEQRIAELVRRLEITEDAFDLCHQHNGNSRDYYFNKAKQLSQGKE